MKCRTVTDNKGDSFELTIEEEKFVRAIERLERMPSGRLSLFASGRLAIRIGEGYYEDEIIKTSIYCDGGDGGD